MKASFRFQATSLQIYYLLDTLKRAKDAKKWFFFFKKVTSKYKKNHSIVQCENPGGGHGNPFQDSCLEKPMDRVAWQALAHRVPESWTRLKWISMHVCTHNGKTARVKTKNARAEVHTNMLGIPPKLSALLGAWERNFCRQWHWAGFWRAGDLGNNILEGKKCEEWLQCLEKQGVSGNRKLCGRNIRACFWEWWDRQLVRGEFTHRGLFAKK